ncbi:2-succinyl-5-enolpyruvyl-6-hydroxy-3-cyclohexene-1-carboxylic-acid synthase [Celerinatantimonas sp. YJH-8]|uniref:2-succinyl-5-enolpyruvyl-6-hydroxy-3- cyclohexene-1-carboxylic-acid synthase n=1 Tax=Celerinatantimonas sp. YJH-8 TaxID=3228714 RepID=UPI0038C70328
MVNPQCNNLNLLWAELIIEELFRLDVRHICIAPGSRSAPLTLAAANHPELIRHVHFDERGLGFFALGIAKATHQSVVLICTSGTAVANLYPAFIEAAQSGYPLIVLAADRPEELIDCGANQAIHQPGIFANYPHRELDLPTPDIHFPPRALLGKLDDLIQQGAQQKAPVLINCRFREPFYPDETTTDFSEYLSGLKTWFTHRHPLCRIHPHQLQISSHPQWPPLPEQRVLIILGALESPEIAQQIVQWANQSGWPVLVDIQSQALAMEGVIHSAEQLMYHSRLQNDTVDWIISFGGRLVGKQLQKWLDRQTAQHWHIQPTGKRLDPNWQISESWHCMIEQWLQSHPPLNRNSLQSSAWQHWQQQLPAPDGENELTYCATLSTLIPSHSQLMIGNSLAIRQMQLVAGGRLKPDITIYANRGCSGIDGLIATGCGLASTGITTTMILGDISLLHDLNSLALTRQLTATVIIIVFNNDGGAIFDLLPVPKQNHIARDYYQLPHGYTFASIAAQFQLHYAVIEGCQALATQYTQALQEGGIHLLELKSRADTATRAIHRLGEQVRELTSL